MLIWLDGRIVAASTPAIAATDPAVLHGAGLFEVTRAYGGVPFRLRDHLERMRRSAAALRLPAPADDAVIDRAIRALCRRNHLPDAYVRIEVTAGGRQFVLTRPLEPVRRPARVTIVPWRRDPRSPLTGHKTLNYLESVRTREAARAKGFVDALFRDLRGNLLEGCVSNVFLVRRGDLVTPPLGQRILPGVTRKVVLEIAARLGVRVFERAVPAQELRTADEAFLTNAIVEVLPIGRRAGPITRLMSMAYRSVVLTETAR